MNIIIAKIHLFLLMLLLLAPGISQAQFMDKFAGEEIEGWFFFTGDGAAMMDFTPKKGHARISVDATKDEHNVWWAIIKRDVSPFLDLGKLKDDEYELRVEARVRVSDAPRRLNFMVNTQRTTNFHKQLKEYDIPDTSGWHTISMTTQDLDAVPGDTLYVQLGVTDWGLGEYYVDIDYYRADIINVNQAGPDQGEPLPYQPPVPELNSFSHQLEVTHDALINTDFPDVNFNDWHVGGRDEDARIFTVHAIQWALLRWDLGEFNNAKAKGAGLLELTTHSVSKGGNYTKVYGEDLGMEFGKIRVIEIIGGDADWEQGEVTYHNFMQGNEPADVFNSQMIFDAEVSEKRGSKTFITLSRPVLQRLLNGTTKGLLIRPLGAIGASFYASEYQLGKFSPKLYFNIE